MFTLPPLPYAADALSPVISERTMRLHHGKHHARYIEVTNSILERTGQSFGSLEAVVEYAARAGDAPLLNNAGQALNHAFFWRSMSPAGAGPSEGLLAAIGRGFGGLEALRKAFVGEGAGHFGSGWVWLVARGGELSVVSTHDGQTMLARHVTPLLVCDLWEHAYYLDHQNDRAGFLSAWWDGLIDWRFASAQFEAAARNGPAWSFADETAREPAGA